MQPCVKVSRKAKRSKKAAKPPASLIVVVNGDGTLRPAKRIRDKEAARKQLRDQVRAHAVKHGIKQARSGYLRGESIDAWLAEHPEDAAVLGRS
jgi:hypothetical protein